MTEFTQSVRHNYRGAKPVTQWFKYHKNAQGFKEGVDYICTSMCDGGMIDWLLTDSAALRCRLGKTSETASQRVPTVKVMPSEDGGQREARVVTPDGFVFHPWVYLARMPNGTFKIGFSADIWSRAQTLGGRIYSAASHAHAFQVEQAAHTFFKPYSLGGEYYRADLPVNMVAQFIQTGFSKDA